MDERTSPKTETVRVWVRMAEVAGRRYPGCVGIRSGAELRAFRRKNVELEKSIEIPVAFDQVSTTRERPDSGITPFNGTPRLVRCVLAPFTVTARATSSSWCLPGSCHRTRRSRPFGHRIWTESGLYRRE